VFGPEAKSRVWLVEDGDVLYVDRNGNGDLTEPGDRVAAKETKERSSEFEAGDIHIDGRTHKNLRVASIDLEAPAERNPEAKEDLEKSPRARRCVVWLDVEMAGRTGRGIGGRVEQGALKDFAGFLEFAAEPRQAPVVHFDGPLQIMLFDSHRLTIGRATAMYLALGTPGVGAGSSVYTAYEQLISDGLFPRAEIVFPPRKAGEAAVTERYELKQRCCTVNFHDQISVPDSAGVGMADVTLSFDGVPGVEIASSRRQVKIIEKPRDLELEPVSPRLKAELVHPDRKGILTGLRFSPDGKRIIASNYPDRSLSGVIQVWDAETGRELTKIETIRERPTSPNYFAVSRDWQSVFVPIGGKRDFVNFEKEGKPFRRWEFGGSVQAWDLSTGKLLRTFEREPASSVLSMGLAPDATTFFTYGELPGEVAVHPTRETSIWNVGTGKAVALPAGLSPMEYSPDSKTLAAMRVDDQFNVSEIKLLDVATAKETASIPIAEENIRLGNVLFSPDGKTLVGQVRAQQSGEHWLKFWDPATGREKASVAGDKNDLYLFMDFSPDSRLLAVTNYLRAKTSKLFLFDVDSGTLSKTVALEEGGIAFGFGPVFGPNKQWVAVTTQKLTQQQLASNGGAAEDAPQPHIHLIDAVGGTVTETIVAPQGFATLLRFSPDGKTLASNGDGRVLLWDLTIPPLAAKTDGE
jgi:WD40 repeat protein